MKRSKVRARREVPRQRLAPRWTMEDWHNATMILLARCGSRCERCGNPLGNELERHHRQRREVGGDRLSNIACLHSACHAWAHAHPEEARELGLIVATYADPAEVPLTKGGERWLLDDTGGQIRAS